MFWRHLTRLVWQLIHQQRSKHHRYWQGWQRSQHQLQVQHISVVRTISIRRKQTLYSRVRTTTANKNVTTTSQTQATEQWRNARAFSSIENQLVAQAKLEDWFITSCHQNSTNNKHLLTVWDIFRISIKDNEHYLDIASNLHLNRVITTEERQIFDNIYNRDTFGSIAPHSLKVSLQSLYWILRHNHNNINFDLTDLWVDANFSSAWFKLVYQQCVQNRTFHHTKTRRQHISHLSQCVHQTYSRHSI